MLIQLRKNVALLWILRILAVPVVLVLFAACILSYFWHNMFSFEQVENLPYFYLMLGLAENRLRQQKTA